MAIYIFLIIILIILSFIGIYCIHGAKRKVQLQRYFLILSFFLLGMVMCLRSAQVGSDTSTYCRIYGEIARTSSIMDAFQVLPLSAPVYILFDFILSRFFSSEQTIIIATSLIICYMMFKTIKDYSQKWLHSLLLFVLLTVYFQAFNGARQMLAVVFAVYAFWILAGNLKSVKGWLIYLIAIGIHNTAIIFLVAIFGIWLADRSKNNKTLFIKTAVLSVVSTLFLGAGVALVIMIFPRYLMYVNGINPESVLVDTGGGRIALLYIFELLIVLAYVFVSRKSKVFSEKKALPALVFCCICGMVFAGNTLIQRLLWYYEALFVIAIPNMLVTIDKKNRFIIWFFMVLVLSIYSVWFLLENKGNMVPYSFF